MLVRNGIDDFGLSLGQFAACTEKTIDQHVSAGNRPPPTKGIELVDDGDRVTLIIPGVNNDVHLEYVVTEDMVLLEYVKVAHVTASDFDNKWQITVMLAASCSSLGG